jgi:hypothetical protein
VILSLMNSQWPGASLMVLCHLSVSNSLEVQATVTFPRSVKTLLHRVSLSAHQGILCHRFWATIKTHEASRDATGLRCCRFPLSSPNAEEHTTSIGKIISTPFFLGRAPDFLNHLGTFLIVQGRFQTDFFATLPEVKAIPPPMIIISALSSMF